MLDRITNVKVLDATPKLLPRAIALLEHHAFSHGLRVVDAIIAASALETASSLATANVKHYRVITPLNLIQSKP